MWICCGSSQLVKMQQNPRSLVASLSDAYPRFRLPVTRFQVRAGAAYKAPGRVILGPSGTVFIG